MPAPGTNSTVISVRVGGNRTGVTGVTAVQEMWGASTPLDRLTQVSTSREEGGTGSVSARIATYRIVSQRIEENPFVGVGLDLESATKPFPLFSYEYDVHNVVIATWYKAGLFGLVGMLTVFLAVFVVGWRAVVGSTSHEEASLAIALLCGLVAFSVLAMGSPILYVRYGWVCAALVLALRAVQMDARVPFQWRRGDRLAIEPSPA